MAIEFRKAVDEDLPSIIQLLFDDTLGKLREDNNMPPNEKYIAAWSMILHNENTDLYIVEDKNKVIGVAQIDYLQYLTYQGGRRALIEGVRIDKSYRGQGLGKQLFQFLIQKAKENGCHLVQLTTDKARPDAVKFYESLGFEQTHIGMKLHFHEKGSG